MQHVDTLLSLFICCHILPCYESIKTIEELFYRAGLVMVRSSCELAMDDESS
jgi:hypothetical protein